MIDQIEDLIKKLENHEDVTQFCKFEGSRRRWICYYDVDGYYKGEYFLIYLFKSNLGRFNFEISKSATNNLEEFQEFLKTLTNLKFTLS